MFSRERLIILDADGTTVDAFGAITKAFAHHGMDIGDLTRFQKRRHLFKYLGGLKEFPRNLQRNMRARKRAAVIATLTEIYRDEAELYPGIRQLIERLVHEPMLRVGIVTRNITFDADETIRALLRRNGLDPDSLDFFRHIPLKEDKTPHFKAIRDEFHINPGRAYACGDEKKDFVAAMSTGMHPFMVSYGFEDYDRLIAKIGVPPELISRAPDELSARIANALDLAA
jgi:phosphoglycolate phosphatase